MTKQTVIRKRLLCRNVKNYLKEYCTSSSIHGIRYFGEKRTYFERGWWLLVFLTCLSFCGYFIVLVYQKWSSDPVIISFNTKETQLHDIPFPAVTICPETKTDKDRYDHTAMLSKLTNNKDLNETEFRQISYMSLICDLNLSPILRSLQRRRNFIEDFENYLYFGEDFIDFLSNVTVPLDLKFCKWMNDYSYCYDLFRYILTEEGVCVTFNMLDDSQIYQENVHIRELYFDEHWLADKTPKNVSWTLDKGYRNIQDIDAYPRRALLSGSRNALSLRISDLNKNIDNVCKTSLQGFRVMLHTPDTVPRLSQHYFRVPYNEVVLSAVQPVMITTSESVKLFKPETRQCYFENEKTLNYFKTYNQRNCQLECLTKFVLERCTCVGFFMPRENGTPICNSFMRYCTERAEILFQKQIATCDCLPSCVDLDYEVETSSSYFDLSTYNKAVYPWLAKSTKKPSSESKLIIYFKNSQFIATKRHELYGPTDFLGNFGGLLGLFTGFSILSLMEIIYFLSIRIIGNIRMHGNWFGEGTHSEKNS